MIGHRLLLEIDSQTNLEVIGVSRKKLPPKVINLLSSNTKLINDFDISNINNVFTLLKKEKPNFIINSIGITIRKLHELKTTLDAFKINSLFPKQLAHWCLHNKSRLIHFSTDCVFNGERGPYHESSLPDAQDLYGLSKSLGEIRGERVLVLRLSTIGRELFSYTELLEWFLQQKEKSINGFNKVIYSGLPMNFIAKEVIKLIENFPHLEGLYQLSSQPISKYELLNLLKKEFQVNCQINPCENKKSNKALITDKYCAATGLTVPSWKELVIGMAQDYKSIY